MALFQLGVVIPRLFGGSPNSFRLGVPRLRLWKKLHSSYGRRQTSSPWPGSSALDPRPWIQGPGSRALDPGPWIQGLGSRALDPGHGLEVCLLPYELCSFFHNLRRGTPKRKLFGDPPKRRGMTTPS